MITLACYVLGAGNSSFVLLYEAMFTCSYSYMCKFKHLTLLGTSMLLSLEPKPGVAKHLLFNHTASRGAEGPRSPGLCVFLSNSSACLRIQYVVFIYGRRCLIEESNLSPRLGRQRLSWSSSISYCAISLMGFPFHFPVE